MASSPSHRPPARPAAAPIIFLLCLLVAAATATAAPSPSPPQPAPLADIRPPPLPAPSPAAPPAAVADTAGAPAGGPSPTKGSGQQGGQPPIRYAATAADLHDLLSGDASVILLGKADGVSLLCGGWESERVGGDGRGARKK